MQFKINPFIGGGYYASKLGFLLLAKVIILEI
ncbi:hypothetical protein ERUR111494_07000 [Erysipelothrix urinaevulpis]